MGIEVPTSIRNKWDKIWKVWPFTFLKVLILSKLIGAHSTFHLFFLVFSFMAFIQHAPIIWPFNSVLSDSSTGHFGSTFIQLSFYVDPIYTIYHSQSVVTELEPHSLTVIMMVIAIGFIECLLCNSYCTKHFAGDIWLNSHKGSSSIIEKKTKAKKG